MWVLTAPVRTARTWWAIIASVASRVVGKPSSTIATESPTRIMSSPAWSSASAVG